MEKCANCERPIGKLETPFIFQDQIVCGTCHRQLNEQNAASIGRELERETDRNASIASSATVQSTWTPNSPKLKAMSSHRKSQSWRGQVKVLCWIGVALWFGPFFLLLPFLAFGVAADIERTAAGLQPIAWLGALITIGSGITLFVTRGN